MSLLDRQRHLSAIGNEPGSFSLLSVLEFTVAVQSHRGQYLACLCDISFDLVLVTIIHNQDVIKLHTAKEGTQDNLRVR